MRILRTVFTLLICISFLFAGCKKDEIAPDNDSAPEITQKINAFIEDVMTDIYLWADEVPDIDIRYEFDPEDYFYKLLNEEDVWSFITDDVEALENSLIGVETTFGYSLAFGRFSNTGNIFGLVEYVYPNTPADEAGLKRGDIIVLMDGKDITDDNYRDLLYAPSVNISRGYATTGGIAVEPVSIDLTAKELSLDPVLITDVLEHGGKKIGYIFYAQYINNFSQSLNNALQQMVNEGINELIIDLRYNPGGGVDAAIHLCSSIAPANVVDNEETLVTFRWNKNWQKHWESQNIVDNLKISFNKNVPQKLDLNKVYFLTGFGSASASELTITGLKPYMEVITIGETTYGKYTASNTFKAEDFDEELHDISNWALQPIIARYANALGVTDFKDGFAPDIPVADSLILGYTLGDMEEPMLKAALQEITGTPVIAKKHARIPAPSFTLFDRGFSKYDANKRELLLNGIKSGDMLKKEAIPQH